MNAPLTKMKHSIMVVDDHPIVRHGLVSLLEAENDLDVVDQCDNPRDTLEKLDEKSIDVLVMDLSLGGMDGLELIKNIKARFPDVRILVVSIHDEKLFAERALAAGAMGYLGKDAAVKHIVEAVRRVLSEQVYLSEEMSDRLLRSLVAGGKEEVRSPLERLSDRELEVLRLLGHGKGTRDVATELGLSVKTIETYRENIKHKLDLKDSNEMIRFAVQWVSEDC